MRLSFVVAAAVVLALAAGHRLIAQQAASSSQAQTQMTDEEFLKGAYAPGTPGLVAPVPKKQFKPKYVPDAMRAKLQGKVELQVVVGEDGRVARVRVTKSLDTFYGLDEQAIAAVKLWEFEPGRLDGRPVPVVAGIVLEFRLH